MVVLKPGHLIYLALLTAPFTALAIYWRRNAFAWASMLQAAYISLMIFFMGVLPGMTTAELIFWFIFPIGELAIFITTLRLSAEKPRVFTGLLAGFIPGVIISTVIGFYTGVVVLRM